MDITVLDTNLKPIAIVDDYISLIWTERYYECGDFELYLPMSRYYADLLEVDYYLSIPQSKTLMIIEERTVDTNVEDGDRFTVTGRSLSSILNRRVIYPQANYGQPPKLIGNLILVLEDILDKNVCDIDPIIPKPSSNNRYIKEIEYIRTYDKTTQASWPEPFKEVMEAQYFGENVYDVIKSLCEEHKIGFRMELQEKTELPWTDSSSPFKLNFYVGTDRSYDQTENNYVAFSSEFDNIISSNYLESSSNFKNYIIVGGEGEGSDKIIENYYEGYPTSEAEPSGFDRREVFVNSGVSSKIGDNTSMPNWQYRATLRDYGKKELKNTYDVKLAFEGEVDATRIWKYGEDFFLGDIVQVMDSYGNNGKNYVSEVVISDDESGYSIYPTFKNVEEED